MPTQNLADVLEGETDNVGELLDSDTLDNILIEPHQDALAEAIAADAVDVAPVIGDLLAAVRQQRAEQEGVEFPEQPAYLENAIGDLPKPIDTIADVVISQNVLLYLQREYDLDIPTQLNALNEQSIGTFGDLIDNTTPD